MSEWLAGRHVVEAVLAAGARRIEEVRVRRGAPDDLRAIRDGARRRGVPMREVDAVEMPQAAGRAAAVAVACGPFPYRAERELPEAGAGHALIVVLDRIQDPQNLGAIARTAAAVGARALCLPERQGAQVTPAAVRASAGAIELLPVHRVANVARALQRLRELGYWTVGLEPRAARRWHEVDYRGGVALVVGAEGAGLRRLVAQRCDHLVALPVRAPVGSLNAGAALAAVAYEVLRQQEG